MQHGQQEELKFSHTHTHSSGSINPTRATAACALYPRPLQNSHHPKTTVRRTRNGKSCCCSSNSGWLSYCTSPHSSTVTQFHNYQVFRSKHTYTKTPRSNRNNNNRSIPALRQNDISTQTSSVSGRTYACCIIGTRWICARCSLLFLDLSPLLLSCGCWWHDFISCFAVCNHCRPSTPFDVGLVPTNIWVL